MASLKHLQYPLLATVMGVGLVVSGPTAGQELSLNYERLSSLEEPFATEIGDVTLVLNGLVDSALIHDTENDGDTDVGLIGNLQISALTQLANRWRVGLNYFGQYTTDEAVAFGVDNGYMDNAALSVGGVWGTALGGNVSGTVRELTRRQRGAGNASLAFDDVLGTLKERSIGYTGRFGPWVTGAVVDEDGNADLGAMFQRPAGSNDYRLTLRTTRGVYTAADGSERFDTVAAGVVGELVYGSSSFDVGVGYEHLSSGGPVADRWYLSSGVRTKTGVVLLSLEGHFGCVEGNDEASVAVGLQYDVARGMSANFGLNHIRVRTTLDSVRFADAWETKAIMSLRYSF